MVAPFNHKTEQIVSAPSPATKPSWRFGDLPAAELMPQLQQYLYAQDTKANWQLVWLNNDGQPIIGLLPTVSWSVYYGANDPPPSDKQATLYKVEKTCRASHYIHHSTVPTTYMSYSEWQDELIAYSQAYDIDSNSNDSHSTFKTNEKPNYHHGLIGFIGYDIAAHELSPASNIELAAQPCALLGHYDIYLTPKKNDNSGWQLEVNSTANASNKDIDEEQKNKLVIALIAYLDALDKKLSDKHPNRKNINQARLETSSMPASLLLNARWGKRHYQQAFGQTQNYLQQGDCYQINLTQEWQGRLTHTNDNVQSTSNIIDYLPALHRNTQAPFAGYLAIQYLNDNANSNKPDNSTERTSSFELLSCSPELFFTFIRDNATGKHHIRTKPIKGTMPRGVTAEQDNNYKQQLIDSEKDRAENVMIVDLLRNDLGKYAKIGSVKVPQLFAIESFSNVHHMVSTITAELRTDTHPLAVLFGSLPAGSITGTPKKRAVEIISELENAPRGAYCGTMGYMNFDGSGQWNVLIRTLQATSTADDVANNTKQVSLWAGGGITVASDCDAEYQECLDKVGNLLSVLAKTAIVQIL